MLQPYAKRLKRKEYREKKQEMARSVLYLLAFDANNLPIQHPLLQLTIDLNYDAANIIWSDAHFENPIILKMYVISERKDNQIEK